MKVYIAAPYPEIAQARRLLSTVEAAGHTVTSRWIREGFEELNAENAAADLNDVRAASVFVAFNPSAYANRGTGGRHVELGFALALGKSVILIGPVSNIFHYLPHLVQIEDDTQLAGALAGLAVEA